MKIVVATDAASPQVNGVVRTYERVASELRARGCEISFLGPGELPTVPLPRYSEIRIAVPVLGRVRRFLDAAKADFIHIATEGPIGWMTWAYCLRRGIPFTTSYHTRFPEYANALFGVPVKWGYAPIRRFHNAGIGTMTATRSLAGELAVRGFLRLLPWSRGVDTGLFRPRDVRLFGSDAPVFLYVGRVSKEKNIEAFLEARLPGRKVVVGGGPHLPFLKQRFTDVHFMGPKSGEELALHYASADVFVFPSRTDTFGLVLLEAMASGLPVAAYRVTGPVDVVVDGVTGVLHQDLEHAARSALAIDRKAVHAHAQQFTWAHTATQFVENIRNAHAAHARPDPEAACTAAFPWTPGHFDNTIK